MSAYNAAARGNNKLSLKNTARIRRPTYSSSNAFLVYRYLRVSSRAFFLTRDFRIFFFFFFLRHRPSALRKHGKGLIFTPNISTGDGGVHRHQAIVPFLLYNTMTNHGAFNFTSLNDAILQLPRLSAYTRCIALYKWKKSFP